MSTISTGTTTTTAFVVTSDTTGSFVVKTGAGAGTTALTIDASQNTTFANPVTFSGNIDANGNLNFIGTGRRITGDFGNATPSNRVMFQNSVTNANTQVEVIPNGTATVSGIVLSNNSDPNNCSNFFVGTVGTTDCRLSGNSRGTGTLLPMTFYTGGSERFRIGTSGQWGVGGANYGTAGQVLTSNGASAAPSWQLPAGLPTMNIVSGTTQAATANNHYVLTNASATTVTLPASPAAGDVVWVTVANGRVDNVIARNGQNINSLAENMTLDNAYAGIQLRYADATRGWVFT